VLKVGGGGTGGGRRCGGKALIDKVDRRTGWSCTGKGLHGARSGGWFAGFGRRYRASFGILVAFMELAVTNVVAFKEGSVVENRAIGKAVLLAAANASDGSGGSRGGFDVVEVGTVGEMKLTGVIVIGDLDGM